MRDANTALSYRLHSTRRIRRAADFARIYDAGHKAGDRHLLVFADRNELGHPRLGVSVSRRHGNAVVRARLKRLLREAFRLSQHDLPAGLDLILIPRQGSGATLDEYRRSLAQLAQKLERRLAMGTKP
jgi:ribonuclease P protein component